MESTSFASRLKACHSIGTLFLMRRSGFWVCFRSQ